MGTRKLGSDGKYSGQVPRVMVHTLSCGHVLEEPYTTKTYYQTERNCPRCHSRWAA